MNSFFKAFLFAAIAFNADVALSAPQMAPEESQASDAKRLDDLFRAVSRGELENVKALIASGIDVNAKGEHGMTALMLAANEGDPEIIRRLLAAKADVNAKMEDGTTALLIAAYQGNVDAVLALIEARADVNAKDNQGWTPLILMARRSMDASGILLQLASNPDAIIEMAQRTPEAIKAL